MTERSQFWATTNTGDGPSSGYTADQMFEVFRALFTGASGVDYAAVAPDYLNKLAVSGSSSPLTVATGAALVYGIPYFNSANVSVAVPTPTTATRIDRIVLRSSWSAQTVRVTRVAGIEGGGAPALTQSAGVTWDMPLAQVQITTGGVITITDEREFLQGLGDGGVGTAKLADGTVTTAKLADNAVTSAKIVDGTIAAADIASNAVTTAKILDANVTTAKIADANVTTAKIADNAVTTTKILASNVINTKLATMAQATVKGRESGAGTGDPADLTAAQLVAIIKTADGAGTGLDADLLDGNQATAFAVAAHTHATATIDNDAVTNSKLANMAVNTIKGRKTLGTGDPEDLTATQAIAVLATADGAGSGLDADLLDGYHYTDLAPIVHTHSTSGLVDASVTTAKIAAGNVATANIADSAVTNAKLANMTQGTIKGRASGAGTGAPPDLTPAQLAAVLDLVSTETIVSFGSDFTGGGTPRVKNIGGALFLQGYVDYTGTTTTLTVLACTLPAGWRPGSTARCVFVDETNGVAKVGYVQSTGGVYIKAPTNGVRYYLDSVTIPS